MFVMRHAETRKLGPGWLSQQDGITLAEILVVLNISGILSAIAIPNWSTLLPTYALNGASRQVQSELHRLKSRAVSENAAFRLVFSTSSYTVEKYSGSYQSTGENKALPSGIALAGTSDTTLGFTSRGTSSDSSDRTVRLCNNKGAGKNIVLSNTGRVRIENGTC